MPWYAWVLVIYIAIDRLLTVGWIGHTVEITPAHAVLVLITGGLFIWAILALAGVAH